MYIIDSMYTVYRIPIVRRGKDRDDTVLLIHELLHENHPITNSMQCSSGTSQICATMCNQFSVHDITSVPDQNHGLTGLRWFQNTCGQRYCWRLTELKLKSIQLVTQNLQHATNINQAKIRDQIVEKIYTKAEKQSTSLQAPTLSSSVYYNPAVAQTRCAITSPWCYPSLWYQCAMCLWSDFKGEILTQDRCCRCWVPGSEYCCCSCCC